MGGHAWQQGDWLINTLSQEIRRGPFGTFLIRLSDLLGTDVIWTTGAVQALLTLVTMWGFWVALRGNVSPPVALLLIAAPTFLVFFWAANPRGALRKELLVYAALALLLAGLPQGRRGLVALSVLLMSAAMLAHEALVLFLPCYLGCMVLARPPGEPLTRIATLALIICAASVVAFAYAWIFRATPDPEIICAPLLARDVSAEVCNGAMVWLQAGMGFGYSQVLERIVDENLVVVMMLAGLVGALPLGYLISRCDRPARWIALVFLAFLPFAPLFVIAIDWGRWINFHMVVCVSLVLAALSTQRMTLVRPIQPVVVWGLLGLGLLWAPYHIAAVDHGGVLFRILVELTPLEYEIPP